MASFNDNYTGKVANWSSPFQRTSGFPLDRSSMFSSYADAVAYALGDGSDSRGLGTTAYVGQIITVYENSKVSVYKIDEDRSLKAIGGGSLKAANYTAAKALAVEDNIGQFVFVENDEVSTTEKDEEGNFITYTAGPYVISGVNTISKLGTTSASGDLAGDVESLKGNVSTLQSNVTTLQTDVKDLTPINVPIGDEDIQALLGVNEDGSFNGGQVNVTIASFNSNNLNIAYSDFYEFVEDKTRLVFVTLSGYQINFTGYTSGGGAGKNLYGLLTFNVDLTSHTVLVTCRLQEDKITLVGQPIDKAYNLATKSELTKLSETIAALPTFDVEIYNPTTEAPKPADPKESVLYLISEGSGEDTYREWIFINGAWEKLGVHTLDISAVTSALEQKVDKVEGQSLIDSTLIPVISQNKNRIDVLEPIVGTSTLSEKLPWQSEEGTEYVAPTLVQAVETLADAYVSIKDNTLANISSNNESYILVEDGNSFGEGFKSAVLTPVVCTLAEVSDEKTGLVDARDVKNYIDTALSWIDVE